MTNIENKPRNDDATQPSKRKVESPVKVTTDLGIRDVLVSIKMLANSQLNNKSIQVKDTVRKLLSQIGNIPYDTFPTIEVDTTSVDTQKQWYFLNAKNLEGSTMRIFAILRVGNQILIARRNEEDRSSFKYLFAFSENTTDTKKALGIFLQSKKLPISANPDSYIEGGVFREVAMHSLGIWMGNIKKDK